MILSIGSVFFACVSLTNAGERMNVAANAAPTAKAWPVPDASAVRLELEHWLNSDNVAEPSKRDEILASWSSAESGSLSDGILFERTVDAMRGASPPVALYLEVCDRFAWQEVPFGETIDLPQIPLQVYLGSAGASRYLRGSLRYYLALRLVQARFYDEADAVLDELTPENSIDPAGVLIHRAIVCNHLGQSDKGLAAIGDFHATLERGGAASRRHVELAKLLEFDLQKQKNSDDPETISRKMNDVRRRLGKGRTDDDTQQAEKDVMKSLEKLIEKIEDQCKKQAQCEGDQGQQSNNPADDSRLLKQKGPGNVDRREFDPGDPWGDLPAKEREEALMRIEKEFPSHYRDIIEQYFREMANRPSPD